MFDSWETREDAERKYLFLVVVRHDIKGGRDTPRGGSQQEDRVVQETHPLIVSRVQKGTRSHMYSSEGGLMGPAYFQQVCLSWVGRLIREGWWGRMHCDGQWLMKWTSLHATAWWHWALSELLRVKLFILSMWSKVSACSKWMILAHFYSRVMELFGYFPCDDWWLCLCLAAVNQWIHCAWGQTPRQENRKFVDKVC